MLFKFTGNVEKIVVNNDKFYLVKLIEDEKGTLFIAGNSEIKIEEESFYEFQAIIQQSGNYKGKYWFTDIQVYTPSDKKNIVRVLCRSIKGVGEKSAGKIFGSLGEETFNLLSENPEIMRTVNVSTKIQKAVEEYFKKNYQDNTFIKKLQVYGLKLSQAIELINGLKDDGFENVIQMVERNPFIAMNYIRIGFKNCDDLAKNIGFPKDHPSRLTAVINHVLNENVSNGSSCMAYPDFIKEVQKYLPVSLEEVEMKIIDLELSDIVYEVVEGNIYLIRDLGVEQAIANYLYNIATANHKFEKGAIKDIEAYEYAKVVRYEKKQKQAANEVFINPITLITGGPGTGKTFTIKLIIELCKQYNLTYKLAAPTGMASRRISASTSEFAQTIHKLLEVKYDAIENEFSFERDEKNPIEADIILLDETSMLDMYLFVKFLRAVKPTTKLVMVGDTKQLPSIKCGAILKDMLESEAFAHVHLDKIKRQKGNSKIVETCYSIIERGTTYPILDTAKEYIEDIFFANIKDPKEIHKYVLELIKEKINNKQPEDKKYDPIRDMQVLLPRKDKKDLSVKEMNKEFQKILNPANEEKTELLKGSSEETGVIFRLGDKVMQLDNIVESNINNGDIGYIDFIDTKEKIVEVKYDHLKDNIKYEYDQLDQLQHAYSISVHKSQGSEFKVTILVYDSIEDYMFLYDNFVFTGISRGQELVVVVGDRDKLEDLLKTNKGNVRHTTLNKFIRKAFGLKVEEKPVVVHKKVAEVVVKKEEPKKEVFNFSFEWDETPSVKEQPKVQQQESLFGDISNLEFSWSN